MNPHAPSLSWILRTALLGMVALALVLLVLAQALPGNAALQPNWPEAITNPQKAAILGGQHLLQFGQNVHFVYLPTIIR